MGIIRVINYIITLIFITCYFYQVFYTIVPFIFRKKEKLKKPKRSKIAILITARNEEKVLPNLLESINKQDYPKKLLTTFVIADNCTDNTYKVAQECGAVVYERFNDKYIGKGYALNELLKQITHDYGKKAFDAFIVFDADNLVKEDFVTEINKVYSNGYEVVTSYRNSKNYGDSMFAASSGLWFLHESQYLNKPRMILHNSCAISGTGFLFSRKILDRLGGWHFYQFTEDIEFTVNNILSGSKIGYAENAMIYDEQPVKFSDFWNQRVRWTKGNLQIIWHYGLKLVRKIFTFDFSAYDISMVVMVATLMNIVGILANLVVFILSVLEGQDAMVPVISMLEFFFGSYCTMFMVGLIPTITEWNRIEATTSKKILYLFTFPIALSAFIPITFVALCSKVEWKHIEHTSLKSIGEFKKIKEKV